jgi:hypothetical protein
MPPAPDVKLPRTDVRITTEAAENAERVKPGVRPVPLLPLCALWFNVGFREAALGVADGLILDSLPVASILAHAHARPTGRPLADAGRNVVPLQ